MGVGVAINHTTRREQSPLFPVASKRRRRLGLLGDVLFSADIESHYGGGSATVSEKNDAYSKISAKFGTSDTMSSLCSRIMSVSLPMLTLAVRHFGTRPDSCLQEGVLGPILETIPNLIAKLDRIRRTATKSADLLVKVVVTTPAGFELLSLNEVVTPLAPSFQQTLCAMQNKIQKKLYFEGQLRRASENKISNAVPTFDEFEEVMGEELCRILAIPVNGGGKESGEEDRKAISDSELPWWPSKVEIPDKMRTHFPRVLFAEEVNSPRGPGVLALVLGLQWGDVRTYCQTVAAQAATQRLLLKPAMWFMPVSRSSGAAVAGRTLKVLNPTVEWSGDELGQFKYLADSVSLVYTSPCPSWGECNQNCVPNSRSTPLSCAFQTDGAPKLRFKAPAIGFNTLGGKYSFRAGAAAAKAAYDKLQQFWKFDNLCLFHLVPSTFARSAVTFGRNSYIMCPVGEMLDECGWARLKSTNLNWIGNGSWDKDALKKMSECGMFNLKETRMIIETKAAFAELKQNQTEKFGDFIDAFADDRRIRISLLIQEVQYVLILRHVFLCV